ncbi:PspC domain-containing protein [Pedobacter boryungensis]|uniref:PspC domain-containing protein n=1 Tax=Pedobacter boryungensis TaxID=869962 RepID=A0ABX2DET5_9SPHI|nr:PspC domain-containing protein [Pedobacter boryungensis]NQX32611.1 PspC domain-containing protein [Pedobacter boryungensis]
MKKTLIINIGNSIIHIEEDAYEILTTYLNEIKQHFAKNADDFEIVTDIENRIAEMFSEILQAGQKQVIELADVQSVIAQMGRVQDFQTEDEEESPKASAYTQFAGNKKLYRDTDEGVIAGVCAGLGHYLNIEARWVRLIAFLSIFLGGSGILAYFILWFAMPRAVSRSEKMSMKGEATNLYGYQRSFDEELAAFKENMKSANAHLGPMVKRSGNFITEMIEVLGRFLNGTGKVIMRIIAGSFIVCGFGLMICLIICLAAFLGFWDSNAYDYFPLSIINQGFRSEIVLGAFVTLFIPVLALVLFAVRVAFNRMAINKTVSFALLIIWLLGVSSTVYYVAKISSEFQEHAELVQTIELKTYPTYVVDVDKSMVLSKDDSVAYRISEMDFGKRIIVDDSDDHPFRVPRNVRIEIVKSDNGKTTMVQTYESQGKTFQIALQNAQNINYKYTQTDSLLTLSPRLELKRESIWRNQEVRITLKVPVGTHLLLNDNIYNYLQFYYYSCNIDDQKDSEYREWVMTEEGLKCKSELDQPKEEINP